MSWRCNVTYVGIITVFLAVASVYTIPLVVEKMAADHTYQDNEEFKREIREKTDALHKNKGKLFDRILLVNNIHKRWKTKDQLAKRNLNSDDLINKINLENDHQLFEGDIDLTPDELLDLERNESYRRKRNAVYNRKQIWTSRRIPYYLDPKLPRKATEAIEKAITIVHDNTCVRWVPYTSLSQKHYVHFKPADGCYSTIGRAYAKSGGQILSIGEGCEWVDVVLHEMTHAMGFYHEQSRNDRGKYIKILWENIPLEFRDQFTMYSHGEIDKMNKDYDMKSLMHYSSTAFGISGKTTIQPIDPSQSIGDAMKYTPLDIVEINALYDCKTSSKHNKMSSWSDWSECDESCYKGRQRFCFSRNAAECPNTNVYGIESQNVKCLATECPAPIDGNWGMWSSWSTCSQSCDEGKRKRTRECNSPPPGEGGKSCIGASIDVSTCLNRRCNIGKYDVDFEDGWGIWVSANDAGLIPWTQLSYPTKTMNTGPRGDHTLNGNGNYIYVESSRRAKGDMARLVSRALMFSKGQCLSFYYNMYGSLTGSLTLWMVPEGKAWVKLFSKSGNQGQNWHNADVTLDHKGNFQLVFEVVLGGKGYSDTALDDIFIDNGACPGYVAPTMPTPKKCEDADTRCYNWASTGECQKNPGYMHVSCKASCGLCGDCKDLYKNTIQCEVWAKQEYCSKTPKYMMVNCKQSCTGCEGSCKDDNTECPRWAKEGECDANPSWMGNNCKKSCKKC